MSLCRTEYEDPASRRFHAQPNAWPACGPQIELWRRGDRGSVERDAKEPRSHPQERDHDALLATANAIRVGQIVAVKGLGGFHLMVNARKEFAVHRLRERKHREERSLALMFPSAEAVKAVCEVSPLEERLLQSAKAPIILLRRARGYAPLPVSIRFETRRPDSTVILAVGAHLKNAIALAVGPQVFISRHIGDLETEQAHASFRRAISDFERLYEATPKTVAADLHPDYLSTRFAQQRGSSGFVQVQHHVAHVLACMAENELEPPLLGVSWDGTGCGLDGVIWGGEPFQVTGCGIERVATLRRFRLPGGDAAVKETRRAALGLLHELAAGDQSLLLWLQQKVAAHFSATELERLDSMLRREVHSPLCSSVGRLFDGVAALAGLRQVVRYEGRAAMELEFALEGARIDEVYALRITGGRTEAQPNVQSPKSQIILDGPPMIGAILEDVRLRVSAGEISARFHNALVEAIVKVAQGVGERRVVLSGGCFQNRYLTERAVMQLRVEGFQPYWHQRVPPNDGGIALGQIVAARRVWGAAVRSSA